MSGHYLYIDGVASELPREYRRYREACDRRRQAVSQCTCGRQTPPDYDHALDCPNRLFPPTVRAVDAYRAYVVAEIIGDCREVTEPNRTR